LIPEGQVSFGKLSQALDYGALTLQLRGDFDAAMSLLLEIAPELGVYVVNSVNPFRLEGQKTVMIEMLEQRGWRVPDRIIVPAGNLGNGSSYGKLPARTVRSGLHRPHAAFGRWSRRTAPRRSTTPSPAVIRRRWCGCMRARWRRPSRSGRR